MALADELRALAFLSLFLGVALVIAIQGYLTWRGRPSEHDQRLRLLLRLGGILLLITIVNFPIFLLHVFTAGGDAINGGFEDGRYLLRYRGDVIDVSAQQWYLNLLHCWFTGMTFVLTGLVLGIRGLMLRLMDRWRGFRGTL
ncbi:MAG: hypothetical protein AAGK00_19455 [Pseudomonadota bacterium]